MRERPILFNGAMVHAILAGQKTQTRRVVKPAPAAGHAWAGWCGYSTDRADEGKAVWAAGEGPLMIEPHRVACPFGQPGDRLWVRETWSDEDLPPGEFYYRADALSTGLRADEISAMRWKPSIHMPRWACRLMLEITAVRVERLQDISEADAIAEGAPAKVDPSELRWQHYVPHALGFIDLWNSTGGDWDSNPWVWVIEFKRVKVQS